MAFPKTLNDMVPAGYVFENASTCRGCGDDIEWWTAPRGSKIPMDPMPHGSTPAISHFMTCSDAKSFRKDK